MDALIPNLSPLIISAPFGNWLTFEGCTPTLGTFTYKPRGGLFYRLWRIAWTLRYDFRAGGWINRLGLPNPGVTSVVDVDLSGKILSIHGFDHWDWRYLATTVQGRGLRPAAVELNLSCPNVEDSESFMQGAVWAATNLLSVGLPVVAKLPPIRPLEVARPMWGVGVRCFHCCNTLPVAGGGLSGKPLKRLSLWAVEELRQVYGGSVSIVGGGGISGEQDVEDYRKAGADHFAVGSMLLNPLNWRKIPRILAAAEGKSQA